MSALRRASALAAVLRARAVHLIAAVALVFNAVSASAQTITYFINDPFGNPVAATDAAGNVLWKENYRPFGERMNNPVAEADNKIGFAGKPYDPSTGLSYNGARYFDPVLGRFTGVDPAGFDPNNIHSFNRYAYGNNNPYKFDDPDGKNAALLFGLAAAFGGFQIYSAMVPPNQQRALASRLQRAVDNVFRSDSVESNQAADGGGLAGPNAAAGDAAPPPEGGDNNDKRNLSQEKERAIRSYEKRMLRA